MLCEICGEKPGFYKCRLCGRIVCKECYDTEKKMCIICRDSICEICLEKLSIDTCILCGRRICRDCMVEIDYARRVCIECYRRYKNKVLEIYDSVARETRNFLKEIDS